LDSTGRYAVVGWLTGRVGLLVATGALTLTAAVTPATGAASGIVTRVRHAVDHMTADTQTAQPFNGAAAVGTLFTLNSNGGLGSHFCSGSVVQSPVGDLVLTAAHCVTGLTSKVAFVPGYHDGKAPYGIWDVTHVYTDAAWQASQSPDDDFAFVTVTDPAQGVPIEDITGAERLGSATQTRSYVQVIGYPDGETNPIECVNWTKGYSSTQLEFDCGGYLDGTSGGPFLTNVSPDTGQGVVIGVIGGFEQGGLTPQVSYSSMFSTGVASLYKTATTS
jgi:V8-like Glu-specific endopeptidase